MESPWSPHGVHQFGVDYDKFGVKSTLVVGVIPHCLLYIIPLNTFYILHRQVSPGG